MVERPAAMAVPRSPLVMRCFRRSGPVPRGSADPQHCRSATGSFRRHGAIRAGFSCGWRCGRGVPYGEHGARSLALRHSRSLRMARMKKSRLKMTMALALAANRAPFGKSIAASGSSSMVLRGLGSRTGCRWRLTVWRGAGRRCRRGILAGWRLSPNRGSDRQRNSQTCSGEKIVLHRCGLAIEVNGPVLSAEAEIIGHWPSQTVKVRFSFGPTCRDNFDARSSAPGTTGNLAPAPGGAAGSIQRPLPLLKGRK